MLQSAWNTCQSCQPLLIGMMASELKQENEMKNEWLYHFASLQFQTWAQFGETKNSLEHQNPVSHDILYLSRPLINCLALLTKVIDIFIKTPRLGKPHRTATSPNSKLYFGAGGTLSLVAVSCFHPSEGVGKACIFKQSWEFPFYNFPFYIFRTFSEKGIWQYPAWIWAISGNFIWVSSTPLLYFSWGTFSLLAA